MLAGSRLAALLSPVLLALPAARVRADSSGEIDAAAIDLVTAAPTLPLLAGIMALWFVRRRRARTPLGAAASAAVPVLLLAVAMLFGLVPPTAT